MSTPSSSSLQIADYSQMLDWFHTIVLRVDEPPKGPIGDVERKIFSRLKLEVHFYRQSSQLIVFSTGLREESKALKAVNKVVMTGHWSLEEELYRNRPGKSGTHTFDQLALLATHFVQSVYDFRTAEEHGSKAIPIYTQNMRYTAHDRRALEHLWIKITASAEQIIDENIFWYPCSVEAAAHPPDLIDRAPAIMFCSDLAQNPDLPADLRQKFAERYVQVPLGSVILSPEWENAGNANVGAAFKDERLWIREDLYKESEVDDLWRDIRSQISRIREMPAEAQDVFVRLLQDSNSSE